MMHPSDQRAHDATASAAAASFLSLLPAPVASSTRTRLENSPITTHDARAIAMFPAHRDSRNHAAADSHHNAGSVIDVSGSPLPSSMLSNGLASEDVLASIGPLVDPTWRCSNPFKPTTKALFSSLVKSIADTPRHGSWPFAAGATPSPFTSTTHPTPPSSTVIPTISESDSPPDPRTHLGAAPHTVRLAHVPITLPTSHLQSLVLGTPPDCVTSSCVHMWLSRPTSADTRTVVYYFNRFADASHFLQHVQSHIESLALGLRAHATLATRTHDPRVVALNAIHVPCLSGRLPPTLPRRQKAVTLHLPAGVALRGAAWFAAKTPGAAPAKGKEVDLVGGEHDDDERSLDAPLVHVSLTSSSSSSSEDEEDQALGARTKRPGAEINGWARHVEVEE